MNRQKLKIRNEGNKYFININGVMDEDLSYSDMQMTNPEEIIINFEKVISINSCGIREWIRWLSLYTKVHIIYQLCPKVIVDQINMVDGFLPQTGMVESFFVPYYSEETSSEKQVLFTVGKEFDNTGIHAPTNILDDAGHLMEMDVIESKYFRFINKKPTAA